MRLLIPPHDPLRADLPRRGVLECLNLIFVRRFGSAVISCMLAFFGAGAAYAGLPDVMHTPQGALDVAAALPGKYGLLAVKQTAPGLATSVGEITGLMKQAIDVAASLPKPPPAEEALALAAAVPQTPPVLTASEIMRLRAFMWPVEGYVFSAFGATRGKRGHGAIDIVAAKGTPIAAAAGGTVALASNGDKLLKGYGKVVIIDHGRGVHTLYGHCDSLLVKTGQTVRRGEYVGTVGRTGRASTDHCHFEVRVSGVKKDPVAFLAERPELLKATDWKSPLTRTKK